MIKYILGKATESSSVEIRNKRCIRYRNKKKICSECIENCPYDAIFESGSKLKINPDRCKRCGICYTSCPSRAIELKNFEIYSTKVNSRKESTHFVSCKEDGQYEFSSRVTCFEMLRPEDIANMCLDNIGLELVFFKTKCLRCEKKPCRSSFENSTEKGIEFLRKAGIEVQYRVVSSDEDMENYKSHLDGEISRGDFFRLAKDQTSDIFKDFIKSSILGKEDFSSDSARRVVAEKTMESIPNKNKPDIQFIETGIFLSLSRNGNCDSCGVCSVICPWCAWDLESEDTSHSFEKCRACKLCMDVCPQKAITEIPFSLKELGNMTD